MRIEHISLIGWLHSVACVAALFLGAWNLLMPKGTATHRLVGRWYVGTMLVVNLSVFGIFHFDVMPSQPPVVGPNVFGIFHWEAVATLLLLGLGVYAARRQRRAVWAYVHPVSMILTYYMLIGGLINEAFVRVTALRDFAMAHAPQAVNVARTPIVGMVQGLAMLLFIVLIFYFMVKVALYRRGQRRTASFASAA